MGRGVASSLLGVVYVVIGILLADGKHYFVHLTAIDPIVSAILAVLLWPLLLVGISLHVH